MKLITLFLAFALTLSSAFADTSVTQQLSCKDQLLQSKEKLSLALE